MLAIAQSELKKSVKQANGVFLYINNDFHIEYTCELIVATRYSYLKAFPLGKFYLYPLPFSPLIEEMNSCLKKKKYHHHSHKRVMET